VQPGYTRRRRLPEEDFGLEVEKERTGKEEGPSEPSYLKLYKRRIPVSEQETAL
jgi:hypothetical protein